jgi:hypothetical protein
MENTQTLKIGSVVEVNGNQYKILGFKPTKRDEVILEAFGWTPNPSTIFEVMESWNDREDKTTESWIDKPRFCCAKDQCKYLYDGDLIGTTYTTKCGRGRVIYDPWNSSKPWKISWKGSIDWAATSPEDAKQWLKYNRWAYLKDQPEPVYQEELES